MNDKIAIELGKRIRTLRKLKGMTQESLGEKAGISYKFIGEIERGEVNPSLNSLAQIAKALGIHVSEIFPHKTDISSQFSHQDIQIIKKALKLLNRSLAKLA
ncbi:helix-turn-helix domain-containing protein [Dissulfurispira sp.]|uniref:helix-turn-helix domain-containing protein n=1 Tax=Dissulfurispira sp. TaxID=2817609 RepID=UPI002FD9FBFF